MKRVQDAEKLVDCTSISRKWSEQVHRVLIADVHAVTRRGLREILVEAYPGVEVIDVATGHRVLEKLGP